LYKAPICFWYLNKSDWEWVLIPKESNMKKEVYIKAKGGKAHWGKSYKTLT
jgi:hypothetical protein